MAVRSIMVLALAGASLTACATGPSLPPTEVLRYHLGEPLDRGTIAVQPLTAGAPASLEFKSYAAAVQGQLIKVGYNPPAPGAKPMLTGDRLGGPACVVRVKPTVATSNGFAPAIGTL